MHWKPASKLNTERGLAIRAAWLAALPQNAPVLPCELLLGRSAPGAAQSSKGGLCEYLFTDTVSA